MESLPIRLITVFPALFPEVWSVLSFLHMATEGTMQQQFRAQVLEINFST